MEDKLQFFVNGKKVIEQNPDPKWTLLWYLRTKLGSCGAKNACGEGGCGACTVMVSKVNHETKEISNLAMNTCIQPVCSLHGAAVVTVEGLGSIKRGLHPIQQRFAKAGGGGAACGFCTPGFIMSMYALWRNNPTFNERELEEAFLGNLCRCTGYGLILDSFRRPFCPKGQQCCKLTSNKNEAHVSGKELQDSNDTFQDLIFPPELQLNIKDYLKPLKFEKAGVEWYTPDSFQNFLELKQRFSNAKVAAGFTEIQFEVRQTSEFPQVLIHPTAATIPEMTGIEIVQKSDCLVIGSLENFTNFKTFCGARQKENLVFKACSHMLSRFGDVQTRNAATIGGSLASGSVGSDSNTLFAALSWDFARSPTQVVLNTNFFKPYGGTSLKSDRVIAKLVIPLAKPDEFVWYGKQSRRHDVDVALLNCAVKLTLSLQSQIEDATIVLNGLALTHLTIASSLSASLIGRSIDQSLLRHLIENGSSLLPATPTDPTLSNEYRQTLLGDMWLRFFTDLEYWVSSNSNGQEFRYYAEIWPIKASLPKAEYAFSETVEDLAACSASLSPGEAQFLDDIPPLEGQLYGAFVTSTEPFARIVSIDYGKALRIPGVVKIFDSKDHDSIFVTTEVQAYGQPIAFIVATSSLIANEAAAKVEVKYKPLEGAVLSIDDAIATRSFFSEDIEECGNVQEAFKSASALLEGQVTFGGQKWLQMEPPAAQAAPEDSSGKFKITFNTANSENILKMVAQALKVDVSQIEVATCGTSSTETEDVTDSTSLVLAVATAVAAKKLQKPVRCALSCADHFKISGGRHPAACNYQMALDTSGKITAVQAEVYLLGGYTANCSMVVLRTLLHSMASLLAHIPNYSLKGYLCKSNTQPKSMAFGEGLLQATFFAQAILDMNMKCESEHLQFWNQVLKSCDYERRLALVQELNEKNSRVKRGIHAMPIHQRGTTSKALPEVTSSVGGSAVCTEVELDAVTGEYRILRTDILLTGFKEKTSFDEVIKGAFMEGVGAFTTEQILLSPDGTLISTGPGTYKLPNVSSCPREFQIRVLQDPDVVASPELKVSSAKQTGLLAGISVFFAIKEAVKSVRAQAGLSLADFRLDAPAAYEAVKMACSTVSG